MQKHAIIISGTSDPSVMQNSVQILFYNENPVRWCSILFNIKSARSPSNKSFFIQFCSIACSLRLTVDRCSFKKERLINIHLRYGAEHVHLSILHMLQYCERIFSFPCACVEFVDVFTWKVTSSLNTTRSSN